MRYDEELQKRKMGRRENFLRENRGEEVALALDKIMLHSDYSVRKIMKEKGQKAFVMPRSRVIG